MVLLRKRKGIITHIIRRPEPLRRFTGIMAVCYQDYREEKRGGKGRGGREGAEKEVHVRDHD